MNRQEVLYTCYILLHYNKVILLCVFIGTAYDHGVLVVTLESVLVSAHYFAHYFVTQVRVDID